MTTSSKKENYAFIYFIMIIVIIIIMISIGVFVGNIFVVVKKSDTHVFPI